MKETLILLLASTAIWLAVFHPMIYLAGILTSFIPTYVYMFKKAVHMSMAEGSDTLLDTKRKEGEKLAFYIVRRIAIPTLWILICAIMWWAFLVISMSEEKTQLFIEGFAHGIGREDL